MVIDSVPVVSTMMLFPSSRVLLLGAILFLFSATFETNAFVVTPCLRSNQRSQLFSTTTDTETTVSSPPQYDTFSWDLRTPSGHYQNVRIHYRISGNPNGPPILLLHGFGANLEHFRYQYPVLEDTNHYKIYSMDFLGFGQSEQPPNAAEIGFSIELFVQQVVAFLNHVNEDQPWTLIGNSIGGLVSLGTSAYQTKRPSQCPNFSISSIVLFNTSGGMSGFRYQDLPVWAHGVMGVLQYGVLKQPDNLGKYFYNLFSNRDTVQALLGNVYPNATNVDDELLDMMLEPAARPYAKDVFLAVFGGPPGPSAEDFLKDIRDIPILCLWGTDDLFTPAFDGGRPGYKLAQFCDSLRFQAIDKAGHCLHDEVPHIVNDYMMDFLQERRGESIRSMNDTLAVAAI